MSMLYITFMGGPRFLLDGADVSDQISSKAAAIIALVLMRATRQMRRSDIISYLWSESSDDAAKYNLRFNLWQIKKALVQADGESLLLVSKDDIKVNPNFSFLCDISEIEQAALEDINSIAELKHLLSLFRGDFFENCSLHNCENFLEYIIQRRYYLENRKLVVYHRLIRLTYENALDDDCLQFMSACEEIDPYNEDIARIRLEILIRRSAWRDAVQYYQMFYSRLLRDVGAEPSPGAAGAEQAVPFAENQGCGGKCAAFGGLHHSVPPRRLDVPGAEGALPKQSDHLERPSDTAPALGPGLFAAYPACADANMRTHGARSGGFYRPDNRPLHGKTGLQAGDSLPERRPLGCAKPGCGRGSAEEMQPQAGDPVTEILCRPCGFAAR